MIAATIHELPPAIKSTFTCTRCNRVYRWFMRGGTTKLIADYVGYSDRHETECAYCKGFYADGTLVGGRR